jgi:lauroyl/myristoyl acyltransferase
MKTLERISAPLFWLGYQILIRLPFRIRKKAISLLITIESLNKTRKIKENIRLLRSDFDIKEIKKGIKKLNRTRVENYAVLLGSKSLNIKKEVKRLEVSGEIDEALALYRNGKKLIIVSPHTGPYDLALFLFAYYVSEKLVPFKLRAFIPAENIPIIDSVTNDLRKVAGDNIIFGRVKKGKTLNEASQYLNEGYIVVFGFDMVRKNNRGVVCRIGDNAKAAFPAGWAVLARRENAIVVPALPFSREKGEIGVYIAKAFMPRKTENETKDIENNVSYLVRMYEPFFRNHFDDWLQLPSVDLKYLKI